MAKYEKDIRILFICIYIKNKTVYIQYQFISNKLYFIKEMTKK